MKNVGGLTLNPGRSLLAFVVTTCVILLTFTASAVRAEVEAVEQPAQTETTTPVFDAAAADPIVRVASHRRCSSRTVVITPNYMNGTLVKSVLFVNGRMLGASTDPAALFHLGVRRFKAGRNNYELVGVFSSGKSASTIGAFSRCSRRS